MDPEESCPLLGNICVLTFILVTVYESLEDGRHALLHEPGRTCSEIMQPSHVWLLETLITTILSSQKIINIYLDTTKFV